MASPASETETGPDLDLTIERRDGRWPADLTAALKPAVATALRLAAGDRGLPAGALEIALVLADDALVQALNRDYRGKDAPTNVLSFALNEADQPHVPGLPTALGDVVLAYETVAREAQEQGKSFPAHTIHLAVHGVLHLIGYDHQDASDARVMEDLETRILAGLDIADPYAELDGP
jgi:probable rRNA maturation factor